MQFFIVLTFILGYLGIATEHYLKINKTAIALLTAVICWTLFAFSGVNVLLYPSAAYEHFASADPNAPFYNFVVSQLEDHLGSIAQILFFLMGAMTIVEVVDSHQGFQFITNRINTRNRVKLLWIVSFVTFFLSSVLDNLTTSIVMVSLVRKLVNDNSLRAYYVSMIVVAANAGGAWTPIGDVTTTMLWIGGQISSLHIMRALFLPSLLCILIPMLYLGRVLKKSPVELGTTSNGSSVPARGSRLMLVLGVGALVSVPVFKTFTHLPPYLGILLGLSVLWIVSEILHAGREEEDKHHYSVVGALTRIDVASVLFFLGILLAVSALESTQVLTAFAQNLDSAFHDQRIIITLIGFLSAIVDNVPLVAASMGMYDLHTFPMDNSIWEYLAYCAGTGGSILIIGSAAGVAVMGMEKINFMWYARRIGVPALLGYLGGALAYILATL